MSAEFLDDRLERYHRFGVKLGLENIRAVSEALGRPHLQTPAIHIAGTNGKGSTAAAVGAVLRAAQFRVGRYTSPHLCNVRERIVVDDLAVSPEVFRDALDAADAATPQVSLTYFEAITACAFQIFATQRVDAAVYEVGLGGRLDATNILEPAVTAVTTIARDHMGYLGDRVEDIAAEKAGIIKPGVPVVCGPCPESARAVLQHRAAEVGAPCRVYGRDFGLRAEPTRGPGGGQTIRWWGRDVPDVEASIPLRGRWQADNVACALAILHELIREGWAISPAAIQVGLSHLQWPGRMEWLSHAPPVLFDGAHNEAAVSAVVGSVQDEHPEGVVPVLAVLEDKDVAAMCAALAPLGPTVIATASPHLRALAPEQLGRIAGSYFPHVIVSPTIPEAIDRAVAHGAGKPVFVVGSLMNYALASAAAQGRTAAPA